jgi:hypothetical protein
VSCALPPYQVQEGDKSSAAGSGAGGAGGKDAVTSSASSGGKEGEGGAGGHGDADGGVCNGDFAPCPALDIESKPCACQGNVCFVAQCDFSGGVEAHGFVCKADPTNPDQLVWTAEAENLQCCPKTEKPCRLDAGEICVVTESPAGAHCATNTCDVGQNLDCQGCAGLLCVETSPSCNVMSGIVFCGAP